MDHQVQQFRSLIQPWLPAYKQIYIAAAGVVHNEKKWLLAAKVEFAPGGLKPLAIPPLNGPVFWTASAVTDFSNEGMEALLGDAASGILKVGPTEASCDFDSTHRPHASFYAGHGPTMEPDHSGPRSPSIIISGGSVFNLFNKFPSSSDVDWHLRALNPPFIDLAGLYASHGLTKPNHDSTLIEIRARAPLFIEPRESSIKEGMAHVTVVAAKGLDIGEIKVGFHEAKDSLEPLRGQLDSELIKWKEAGPLYRRGEAVFRVGRSARCYCFLSYRGMGVQQTQAIDQAKAWNLRYAVHAAFDPDLDVLRRMLFDSKRDSKAFEDGVAMVFGMLGFSVSQHGRSKKLSDATDIVAISPYGATVAIECTLGFPNHAGQISTALQRSEAIRKSLKGKGAKVDVAPIIVTAMTGDDVVQERSEAEGRGVAVICADDLEMILQTVQATIDADQWLRDLQGRTSHFRLMKTLGQG